MSQRKMTGPASLASLARFKARIAGAAGTTRDALATMIRTHSVATLTGRADRLEDQIDAALRCVQALPAMTATLERVAFDASRPVFQRIGALAALHYGAAPRDALDDNLPGGYGLLDDWLLLNAASLTYAAAPELRLALQSSVVQQAIADTCTLVWLSLPPAAVAPLTQLISTMEQEAAWLSQMPQVQLGPLLEQLLTQPAPMHSLVPPSSAANRPGLAGWSRNANGAIWGSGDGRSVYMQFEGGGSVGMVGGKIVGGP